SRLLALPRYPFVPHAPAPPDAHTLSLHDALPICHRGGGGSAARDAPLATARRRRVGLARAGADVGGDATGAPRCGDLAPGAPEKIGRAACKERRKVWVGGGQCKTTRVRRVSAST